MQLTNIWNDSKKKQNVHFFKSPDATAEPWGAFLNLAKNITVSFIVPVFLKS